MEAELVTLRTSSEELGARRRSGERKDRENTKLKSIISSQDEQVGTSSHPHPHVLPSLPHSFSLSLPYTLTPYSHTFTHFPFLTPSPPSHIHSHCSLPLTLTPSSLPHTHTCHSFLLSLPHTLIPHSLSLPHTLPLSQIVRLQAELEHSHAATVSKDHELAQAASHVAHLTQERDLLLRTTEMYEVDKRELQDEVRTWGGIRTLGRAVLIGGVDQDTWQSCPTARCPDFCHFIFIQSHPPSSLPLFPLFLRSSLSHPPTPLPPLLSSHPSSPPSSPRFVTLPNRMKKRKIRSVRP